MNKTKKILSGVLITFAALIFLIPFWYSLLLSFKDYSIVRGIWGSAWAGFKAYGEIFKAPYFMRIFSNTVVMGLLGTVTGAIYVLLASLVVGSAKKPVAKAVLTLIFVLPSIVPVQLFASILPTEFLIKPSFLLRLTVAAIDGLRISGIVVAAAFFIKGHILKESIKCMLLFIAIRLISLLSADLSVITSTYNPMTYEILDVFSSYTYRTGLMQGDYSFSSAMHIIKVIMQFIPAVAGCVILAIINKPAEDNISQHNGTFMPAVLIMVVPLFILAAVIIKGGSLLPELFNTIVIKGYINSLIISVISAFLVALIAVLMAAAARNSGVIGIIALTLLCLTGKNVITNYMLAKTFYLANTILAVILNNFGMIAVLALIMCFAMCNGRGFKQYIVAFIIGFVLMFGWFWGDYLSPMVMLNERELFPLPLILREITMAPEAKGIFMSTLPYIIVPVILSGVGLTVSSLIKND